MESYHELVEAEARHDYDPEPDYERPTEAEEQPDAAPWDQSPTRPPEPIGWVHEQIEREQRD